MYSTILDASIPFEQCIVSAGLSLENSFVTLVANPTFAVRHLWREGIIIHFNAI